MHTAASPVAAEIDGALPTAIDPFALSLNENPFPPLPGVRSALIRSIDAANRYPEFLPERLRSLIAGHIGVPADRVVLGAGATGVVLQALQALTNAGDTIAFSSPTFDGYPIIAQMARLNPVTVPLDQHGHNDLDGLADAAATARAVVVCRPHNPTGTLEPTAEIVRFLRQVPRDTIVLLDEAYIEFAAPEHRIDVSALTARFPNVVVVRTFSKAYGLAGLRIGYGVASAQLAEALWTQQLPFGIAITSLLAVAASYDAEYQLLQRIRQITADAATCGCGWAPWGSTPRTHTRTSSSCPQGVGGASRGATCSHTPGSTFGTTPTAPHESPWAAASPVWRCWRRCLCWGRPLQGPQAEIRRTRSKPASPAEGTGEAGRSTRILPGLARSPQVR